MKKTNLTLLAAALSLCCAYASAAEFGLQDFSADDIRVSQSDLRAPAPQVNTAGDTIGMDIGLRVPFKLINNAVGKMEASNPDLKLIDKSAPAVFKSGEFLKISNLRVNAGGIIVEPTITLKPYLEARDRVAIKVQRVQVHASMEPSVRGRAAAEPQLSQEDIMDQVMGTMIKSVSAALDAKLREMKLPLRAQDVVTMKYDKAAWILHVGVSSKVMYQFVPADLVGPIHLTGFSLTETGIAVKLQTAN